MRILEAVSEADEDRIGLHWTPTCWSDSAVDSLREHKHHYHVVCMRDETTNNCLQVLHRPCSSVKLSGISVRYRKMKEPNPESEAYSFVLLVKA